MTGEMTPSIWMRPERAAVGRPAQHSRAKITAVALDIADREGLDAVSMRRVASEIGTGAASLYRYVETREDLLDLLTDATGAEYELTAPTEDWLADLVALGEQGRVILRRHHWLAGLIMTRSVIGPNGLVLLQHFLTVLERHPAGLAAKMEAFAILNGVTAAFVLQEQAESGREARNLAFLQEALVSGAYPRLAELISQSAQSSLEPEVAAADRYPDIIARILTGLLGRD